MNYERHGKTNVKRKEKKKKDYPTTDRQTRRNDLPNEGAVAKLTQID